MRFNSSSSAEVRRSGQVRLNVQQKAHVVAMVYSSLEHELAQLVAASQRSLAELDAMLEETKIRIHELKKESYEFRREIVKGKLVRGDIRFLGRFFGRNGYSEVFG